MAEHKRADEGSATVQMVTVVGLDGDVRWVSPSITQLLGWPMPDLASGVALDLVHPDDHAIVEEAVMAAAGGGRAVIEHRMRSADGQYVAVVSSVQRMAAGDEDLLLVLTEKAQDQSAEAALGARYRGIIANSNDALVVHAAGVIVAVSPSAPALLGLRADEVVGHEVFEFVATGSLPAAKARLRVTETGGWPERQRLWLKREGGSAVEVEISSCPAVWDGDLAVQMTLRPTADAVADAVRLSAEAVAASSQPVIVTDPTGRIVVWNQASEEIYGWSSAEAIGHHVEDLLPWAGSDDELRQAAALIDSGGVWRVVARQQARDGSVVFVQATTRAVTDADGHVIARVSVNEPLQGRGDDALLAEVEAGLSRGEFEVWYQPIVRPRTAAIVKVEALVRWRHPTRGLLPPAAFLAAVERSPLIAALDEHVLRTACAQVAVWRAGPAPGLELAVNISGNELADDDLPVRVADAVAQAALPPHALWLEVTETAVAEDFDAATEGLHRLRGLGVRLALDDFGTGFAHLVQLRRLPVQAVKIDRSFVAGMEDNTGDAAIVRSVIALGRDLGLTVVAEGVETTAEREALVDLRCDLAQGYLFGRPVPACELSFAAGVDPLPSPYLEGPLALGAMRVEEQPLLEQARRAFYDQSRYLQAVLDGSPNIICRITPEGLVDAVNDSVLRILGAEPRSYIGTSAFDLVHPDDLAGALIAVADSASRLGPNVQRDLRIRHADGHWLWVGIIPTTIDEHDGQRSLVLSIRELEVT